jgi:hypothetical protein
MSGVMIPAVSGGIEPRRGQRDVHGPGELSLRRRRHRGGEQDEQGQGEEQGVRPALSTSGYNSPVQILRSGDDRP